MSRIGKWNIKRAKSYLLGRLLCRLAGDEKGAVMMEYVIVAVLIAAGCVVAVAMFGRTIVDMFNVASKATVGEAAEAKNVHAQSVREQKTKAEAAAKYHDDMHDDPKEDSGSSGK